MTKKNIYKGRNEKMRRRRRRAKGMKWWHFKCKSLYEFEAGDRNDSSFTTRRDQRRWCFVDEILFTKKFFNQFANVIWSFAPFRERNSFRVENPWAEMRKTSAKPAGTSRSDVNIIEDTSRTARRSIESRDVLDCIGFSMLRCSVTY